jgi:hypothetical protein
VSAADLTKALVPLLEHESPRDHRARRASLSAALKDIGIQTLSKKVRLAGQMNRLWALRDASAWVNASTTRLVEAATLAHRDFKANKWSADAITQQWIDGDEPPAEQKYTWMDDETEEAA